MAQQASICARVDPVVKAQAEAVLGRLGISMSTAVDMYLRQIAMQRKIPFEVALPTAIKPIAFGSLSEEEFDALIEKAYKEYEDGLCTPIEEFEEELHRVYGI